MGNKIVLLLVLVFLYVQSMAQDSRTTRRMVVRKDSVEEKKKEDVIYRSTKSGNYIISKIKNIQDTVIYKKQRNLYYKIIANKFYLYGDLEKNKNYQFVELRMENQPKQLFLMVNKKYYRIEHPQLRKTRLKEVEDLKTLDLINWY